MGLCTTVHMMVVTVAHLLKNLDNHFESAREDQGVPVNKKAANVIVMFCVILSAEGYAEMQVPVRC